MSSIIKDYRGKSPYWIACFRGADGRRLKRSTGTTDTELAKKIAGEWEDAGKLAREGRLTESRCRKVIAEMYERAVGEPLHFRTTRTYLSEWLEGKRADVVARSYVGYSQVVHEFLDHLGSKAERLLREISPTDIRSWRDKLKAKGLSARTVNGAIKILRMPFKAAHDAGYIEINPNTKNTVRPLKDDFGILGLRIERQVGADGPGKLQAIFANVRGDYRAGAGGTGNGNCKKSGRSAARDQQGMTGDVFRQDGVDRVAQRLLQAGQFRGDFGSSPPADGFWERHVFGKGAVTVEPQDDAVFANVGAARPALEALSASPVRFRGDLVAYLECGSALT